MKKKLLTAILTGAMLVAGMSTTVWADGEKAFVYGTTGYSEEMGDAGLNPHDNYSGWSALRYGVGETLFKYNDNMEVEPWLATDYEFVDDTTVKITLRDVYKRQVHLCSCHGKECIDTPYKGCHRAECDQRVHIPVSYTHLE